MKDCPTCRRPFTSFQDFPKIRIIGVTWPSDWIEEHRSEFFDLQDSTRQRIYAYAKEALSEYLTKIHQLLHPGNVLASNELLPSFEKDGYFRWAYEICRLRDDDLWGDVNLAFQEETLGEVQLQLYGPGINMGSAGGPTLLDLGSLLKVTYEGLLPEN